MLLRRHSRLLQMVPERLLPADWSFAPPDFVGIGAQRSGTTWWYSLIAAHPGVYHPPLTPKERNYFVFPGSEPATAVQAAGYRRIFPRPNGLITGEWTPEYMLDFWTPALLHEAAPDARLLVLLRDPVDRFRSAQPRSARESTIAFERGFYWAQLQRVLAHFDRERLLVLQYERCRSFPETELSRTYAFLGVAADFEPEGARQPVNPSRGPKPELTSAQLRALRDAYRADAEALAEAVPTIDLTLWRTLFD
jgi:hypothetical protein